MHVSAVRVLTMSSAVALATAAAACGSSGSPSPTVASSNSSPAASASPSPAGTSVDLGSNVTVTLPAGWSQQSSGWTEPSRNTGVSVANSQNGAGAVVINFAVNEAATTPPNHAAPASAGDALADWASSLDDSVDTLGGPISSFSPNTPSTNTESGPGYDQSAYESYTGAVNGGQNQIAGYIEVLWNSTTHSDVMLWMLASDQSHAEQASADLQVMAKSIASGPGAGAPTPT